MIRACVIYYNDCELLERLLINLSSKKVDEIYCIDGAFKDFPHDKPYSTDGSIEIARKYAHINIECKEAWESQAYKRTQYFNDKLSSDDFYFIIDTDEYVEYDFNTKPCEDVYRVPVSTQSEEVWLPGLYCRLLRHQDTICYDKKHNMIKVNGILINNPSRLQPIYGDVTIKHTPEMRGEERLELDGQYMRGRLENQIEYYDNSVNNEDGYVLLRYAGKGRYTGSDCDTHKDLIARHNDSILSTVSNTKRLLSDFPKDWEVINGHELLEV